MAYGLPVEGEDGPFAGAHVSPVATCGPQDSVGAAAQRLRDGGGDRVIVVHDGLAIGVVDLELLAGAGAEHRLLDVMSVVPATVRPSVLLSTLAEAGETALVTASDGRLLGTVVAQRGGDGTGEGGAGELGQRMETELTETLAAVREHFGDRDPGPAELEGFLKERLVAEGWPPEEADRFLSELGEQSDD